MVRGSVPRVHTEEYSPLYRLQRAAARDPRSDDRDERRPLGEVLEEGGAYMQTGESSGYAAPPGILRTTLGEMSSPEIATSLRLSVANHTLTTLRRRGNRKLLTYHPPESDEIRYLFATRPVLEALLDRDFELPQSATPLVLRDMFGDGCVGLTQAGYEFLMQQYRPTFIDDPLLGEITTFDGTSLTARRGRGIRTASASMPRSTILALNRGLEDGTPDTVDNELSDRIVTGRFEPGKRGQYPSEQLFHGRD